MNSKIILLALTLKKETEEIGICSIASFLKSNNFDVDVYSFEITKLNDDIWNNILKSQPKYIGISIYDATKNAVYFLCQKLKELCPSVIIIVGGAEAYCNPEKILLEERCIDFVIYGEGEQTILELIQEIAADKKDFHHIHGISYIKNDSIIITPPRNLMESIKELPMPDRSIFIDNKIRVGNIVSSRGCRGNCSFCLSPSIWHKNSTRWRGIDVNDVINQIEWFVSKGIRLISIRDSSYEDPSINRMIDIAESIMKRGLRIYYSVNFRPSIYKIINNDILDLLKKSGLIKVFIGVESFNNKDLKLYNKGVTVFDNIHSLQFINENDITVQFGFINFNPYSTMDNLLENYYNLKKIQYISPSNLYSYSTALRLYPKTVLYDKIKADDLLYNDDRGLGYRFKDERVARLAKALFSFFDEYNNKCGEIVALDLSDKYIDLLSILEKELVEYNDLTESIKTIKNSTKHMIVEHFHKHDYFYELITLAQYNWDDYLAREIFMKAYNYQKHNNIIVEVKNKRKALLKKIYSNDLFCKNLIKTLF